MAAAADPSEPWRVDLDGDGVAAIAWVPASTPARLAVVTDEGRAVLVNADRETVETLTGHAHRSMCDARASPLPAASTTCDLNRAPICAL